MAKPNKPSRNAKPSIPVQSKAKRTEKPISDVYPAIDNDLARDNLENDIPAADLPD